MPAPDVLIQAGIERGVGDELIAAFEAAAADFRDRRRDYFERLAPVMYVHGPVSAEHAWLVTYGQGLLLLARHVFAQAVAAAPAERRKNIETALQLFAMRRLFEFEPVEEEAGHAH